MVSSIVRLVLAVGLLSFLMSFGVSEPGNAGLPFGIGAVWAEDCPAEYQNCDGEGLLSGPPGGTGGGGGGGGQVREACAVDGYECEGSDCNGYEEMGHSLKIIRCKDMSTGRTTRIISGDTGECCWR